MAIAKVYFDVSMAKSFIGLQEIAKNKNAEYVMFVNVAKTAAKILINGENMFYLKKAHGKIEMEDLEAIPARLKSMDFQPKAKRQVSMHIGRSVGRLSAAG